MEAKTKSATKDSASKNRIINGADFAADKVTRIANVKIRGTHRTRKKGVTVTVTAITRAGATKTIDASAMTIVNLITGSSQNVADTKSTKLSLTTAELAVVKVRLPVTQGNGSATEALHTMKTRVLKIVILLILTTRTTLP